MLQHKITRRCRVGSLVSSFSCRQGGTSCKHVIGSYVLVNPWHGSDFIQEIENIMVWARIHRFLYLDIGNLYLLFQSAELYE